VQWEAAKAKMTKGQLETTYLWRKTRYERRKMSLDEPRWLPRKREFDCSASEEDCSASEDRSTSEEDCSASEEDRSAYADTVFRRDPKYVIDRLLREPGSGPVYRESRAPLGIYMKTRVVSSICVRMGLHHAPGRVGVVAFDHFEEALLDGRNGKLDGPVATSVKQCPIEVRLRMADGSLTRAQPAQLVPASASEIAQFKEAPWVRAYTALTNSFPFLPSLCMLMHDVAVKDILMAIVPLDGSVTKGRLMEDRDVATNIGIVDERPTGEYMGVGRWERQLPSRPFFHELGDGGRGTTKAWLYPQLSYAKIAEMAD
jgi:hypothetical protein